MQKNNWIDRQTRAALVEFATFNPNIKMFAHCYLLFEFLPTGSIVKSFRFSPMTLFDGQSSLVSLGTICAILYLLMIFALTVRQIFVIKVQRGSYLKQMWTFFDLALIAFSFTAFAVWLYRIWDAQTLMGRVSRPDHAGHFLNLQMLAYWDGLLSCVLAVCSCLGSLKFIKILRFNRTIRRLDNALRIGARLILSFGCVFLVCIFGWIQAGYVQFNGQVAGLSTFQKSFETCFLILLGKFDLSVMLAASPTFTVIFRTRDKFGSARFGRLLVRETRLVIRFL